MKDILFGYFMFIRLFIKIALNNASTILSYIGRCVYDDIFEYLTEV